MGALTSRQHAGVEEIDIVSNHAYKYPPRSGNYFGSHFIMGGERFDTPQPESYLFGENSDLNFLGSRPTPFPYPPPQPNEPTKTLKSLVNIRKESLRFVRAPPEYGKLHLDRGDADAGDVELGRNTPFNMEFTFDCDVRCSITIYYFCTEEFTPNGVSYISKDPNLTSETYHYKRGANQQFCQMSHAFNPSRYTDQELLYDIDREIIPIAIHCVAEEGPEDMRQSHTTIATVEKSADGSYVLKALKQKLFVDGLCYLLQEIYGIENKNSDKTDDDEGEDNGSECVICMCDVRDTLILPCRHLCLCNSCADSLRYQANNCPICRAPFRALLQIRALQKSTNPIQPPVSPPDASCDNIPPGYEAVSLIEALNGPCITRQPPAAMPDLVETPDNDPAVQAAQILNRHLEKTNKTGKDVAATTPEFGMSVLTGGQDEESKELQQSCPLLVNEGESNLRSKHSRSRDTVRHINERSENEGCDDDSEAEKLSPLLKKAESPNFNSLALNVADVTEPIDDAFSDKEDKQQMQNPDRKSPRSLTEERGDESDYYTPEEGAPISSALYDSNPGPVSSVDSTPQRLPGTPMSHASARSSADSYTSGSSTKHLLVTANNCSSDKAVRI